MSPDVMDAILRAMNTAELIGINADSGDRSDKRTAAHEAGHVMIALIHGIDFAHVEVKTTADRLGCMSNEGLKWLKRSADFEAKLELDLGGAVAELLLFGDIEAFGVEEDIRVALARSYIITMEGLSESDEGLAWVRAALGRAYKRLRRRLPALNALAAAIETAGRLSRLQCVKVVRGAGSRVRVHAISTPTSMRSEVDDIARALEDLAQAKTAK